ncbi:hypothetical protein HPB50_008059 [Hyalomma asiaticum]|uniref:Uncharacterized protein n=1 Tax=Hyalomma asiaticum TaxID=266040 RepID=A0ACB7SBT1_HYAAI|nr:hypothetical protein HPB50_008059 [Hyalomma asiaticum]
MSKASSHPALRLKNPNMASIGSLDIFRIFHITYEIVFQPFEPCIARISERAAISVVAMKTRLLRYDTFALAALRRKVHGYFMRNEMPTAEKLRNDVISETDMDMPTISTRTMQRMLNDLGFLFRKRKRNSALLERDDIVAWRRKYLRTIREMRRQQRTIHYLDETWVNAGHTKETVWPDTKVMSRQDAFRQGLSTGLRAVKEDA